MRENGEGRGILFWSVAVVLGGLALFILGIFAWVLIPLLVVKYITNPFYINVIYPIEAFFSPVYVKIIFGLLVPISIGLTLKFVYKRRDDDD